MLCSENMGEISRSFHSENRFLWSFPNVFASDPRRNVESCMYSPWFSYADDTWRLAVIRNVDRDGFEHLGLFLWKKYCISSSSQYCVNIGLKNHEGNVCKFFEGELDIFGCFGKWEFMKIHIDKNDLSQNGCLNFFCEIRKKAEIPNVALRTEDSEIQLDLSSESESEELSYEDKKDAPEAKGVDRLVQNLKKLLVDGNNSDAVLKAENQEFRVHKTILTARSPVFASMFQHDMEEKNSGVVNIPDCSAAAFEILLSYMYTGSAETMSPDNVFNLYYAADKYQIDDLKAECIECMKNTLSVDTFCDVISLSLRHSESDLQKAATRFFCENVKKIVKTVKWQRYVEEYPTEANELFIKAVNP